MIRQKDKKMGRVTAEVVLTNYQDMILADAEVLPREKIRTVRVRGIVDTGATRLVLPKSIVEQLGLTLNEKVKVRYADERRAERYMVRNVWVQLLGRQSHFDAIVEPKRKEILIGAIVLEDLDLLVDCTTQQLHPRDPKQIVSEIE